MQVRELDYLFGYELLKNFGLALIGLFLPVYLFEVTGELSVSLLWLGVNGLTAIIAAVPVERVIAGAGYKHGLLLSYLFIAPVLLIIRSVDPGLGLVAVLAAVYQLGHVFHNIGMNAEFSTDSGTDTRDEDAGKMLSLPNISRILAPVTGGLIYGIYGFPALAVTSVAVLLLSAPLLLRTPDHSHDPQVRVRQVLDEELTRFAPLFMIRGIQAVAAVALFGIYVFAVVGGAIDVGAANSLDTLGFVVAGLAIGYIAPAIGRDRLLTVGCLGAAAMFLLRGIVTSPLGAFAVSFVSGLFFQLYHVPVYASFADRAEETDELVFYTVRKMALGAGKLVTVSLVGAVTAFSGMLTGLRAGFLLGAVATVAMALIFHRLPEQYR